MFQELLEEVRAEVSGERALEAVRALSRFHRVQASPGYDEACDWTAARLESIGYRAEIETVAGDGRTRLLGHLMPAGWVCERARASLVDGREPERLCDYEAEALSLVLRSAPARGRFRVVAVEDGTEDDHYRGVDVRSAVVLTRGEAQRVHQLAVEERGAAGLLCDGRRLLPPVRDGFDDPDALAYTSFWWPGEEPRGWGFVVSPRVGARLRERIAGGQALTLEAEIEARAFPTRIPLLSARLPGRGTDEVLIVSHLCHPRPSANDNASGAASNLEAARALWALRARGVLPEGARGARFLWVPEFTGTYAWLAQDSRRASRTAAALNLDMVGQRQDRCGSTLWIEHPPCFAGSFAEELLRAIRARADLGVSSHPGPGRYSPTRMGEAPYSGGSDHAVLVDPAVGIPCPMLIQWPDRFYHSSHDTPDKCDPGSLALAARCAATYAGFLCALGESERRWLAGVVARGIRRRLLETADGGDTTRRIERELCRGRAALASLARLGEPTPAIAEAQAGLAGFAARELHHEANPAPALAGSGPRLRRRIEAPLHHQRHLLPGYAGLPREERESWRRIERSVPHGPTLTELAWHACDGRRTAAEIARLAWLETGRSEPEFLDEFFRFTGRLGLSGQADQGDEPCSPREPRTVTR